MFRPSSNSSEGPTTVAAMTLSTTTIATVPASEASSEPGTMKRATIIDSSRVLPAKATVRPACRLVAQAASRGSAPSANSSRKRETISSA